MVVKGECLCAEVKFEVDGELPDLYQCHCSLCRKATGSTSNAATFVDSAEFRWVAGQSAIRSFQKPTGYRSDFCGTCGSPVPNQLRGSAIIWIPAGLLHGALTSKVAVHLHLGSSASWEVESDNCLRLQAGPDSLEALNQALQRRVS